MNARFWEQQQQEVDKNKKKIHQVGQSVSLKSMLATCI